MSVSLVACSIIVQMHDYTDSYACTRYAKDCPNPNVCLNMKGNTATTREEDMMVNKI
jgi:hypothetical protein